MGITEGISAVVIDGLDAPRTGRPRGRGLSDWFSCISSIAGEDLLHAFGEERLSPRKTLMAIFTPKIIYAPC